MVGVLLLGFNLRPAAVSVGPVLAEVKQGLGMGEVATGGQYAYFPGMTVQKAIAVAGGFSPRAEQGTVDITRQVGKRILTGRVLVSDPILPGDTVYVRERWF